MLQLVSLNMEGVRHYDTIIPFLEQRQPDVICLQEMPAAFVHELFSRGYFVHFAGMSYENPVAPKDATGLGLATKLPTTATTHYYTSKSLTPLPHDKHDAHSKSYPVISTTIPIDGTTESITVVTTHLYDTWNGTETTEQTKSVSELQTYLATVPPHILCGDFNMPRGYNTNYEQFCQNYRDEIPRHYTSSLDRTIHRAGNRTDLNTPIFDIYMVDYIFSQPPYIVDNVQLHFGISDHAAVTAEITKNTENKQ
jgi:endonuclease/exonuclease/phosphatase family metal-dependent hydrolase